MSHLLDEIIQAHKRGQACGLPSICSAHPWVLKTALRGDAPVLIEATCNQVNQFGGYTGMSPADFVRFVHGIAAENGFPAERLLLGGDHLGPSPWQAEPQERAMSCATVMVQAYVQAGFTKIHLDASMRLGGDDPVLPLDPELAARRSAYLAKAAEAASDPGNAPRYVIGTEVPTPGGATVYEAEVKVTTAEDARETFTATREAFVKLGLESAWERVIAMVVQPGVEFGDDFVLDYDPVAAQDLARFADDLPLVYEAHSTDYQTRINLRNLVRDHFAILKVGPALTFAFREAVFALTLIEAELFPAAECSHLMETLDEAMLQKPAYWEKHYHGSERELLFARQYSLSDRVRYYWPAPTVQAALNKLLLNLTQGKKIPRSLLSQYAPIAFDEIYDGSLPNHPLSVIDSSIRRVLNSYQHACFLAGE